MSGKLTPLLARGACPDPSQLAVFCAGKISDADFEMIAGHIEACPACSQWIQSHAADDTVASMLRQADPLKPYAAEPALREMPGSFPASAGSSLAAAGPSAHGAAIFDPAQRLPATLGPYRILELLGRGGMGEVYKAFDENLHCAVALKILHQHRLGDERILARFSHERKAIGSLDHPNIVRARAAGQSAGFHYLVMDLVDGMDLKRMIRDHGPMPVRECCGVIVQAAAGLQRIHENGLVHRDIKPSNLMLDRAGTVKILDLGLVQWQQENGDSLTVSQDLLGTVDYMAPEQASNPRESDIRADIYSLACTMFELLTGQPPFSGPGLTTLREKLQAHHEALPPSARALNPQVPEKLDAVLCRALAKNPAERFAAPQEFAAAIQEWSGALDGPPAQTLPIPGLTVAPATAPVRHGRRTWLAWIIGGTAAGVAGISGWVRDFFRSPTPTNVPVPDAQPPWTRQLIPIPLPGIQRRAAPVWVDERKAVSVVTSGCSLLRAGDLKADETVKLSVVFEIDRVEGQWGIFLGYRTVELGGSTHAVFHFLELIDTTPGKWHLRRRLVYMDRSTPLPRVITPDAARGIVHREHTAAVATPRTGQPLRLDLHIHKSRLTRIEWNGIALPDLVADSVEAEFQPVDYIGPWGICTRHTIWLHAVEREP